MQTERTRTNQSLFYTASELSTLAKRKWAGGLREAIKSAATRRVGACLDSTRTLSNSELRPAPRIPPDRSKYLILEPKSAPKPIYKISRSHIGNQAHGPPKSRPRPPKNGRRKSLPRLVRGQKRVFAYFCVFLVFEIPSRNLS